MAHSEKTRREALAAVFAGRRISDVARATGVPKQTIARWRQEALAALQQGDFAASAKRDKPAQGVPFA
jgi:transposase-like protein